MNCNKLKLATLLTAACLAWGQERSVVVVRGTAERNSSRAFSWTVCEEGALSSPYTAEAFKVPKGRRLLITEAAFTVRARGAKAARLRIYLKTGMETFDLAVFDAGLTGPLAAETFTKRFTPGLPVAGGQEVRGEVIDVAPSGTAAPAEVTFYGYFIPQEP